MIWILMTVFHLLLFSFVSLFFFFYCFIHWCCDRDGFPSARFVLMKAMEDDGLTFFTNYGSRKAQDIVSADLRHFNHYPRVPVTWIPWLSVFFHFVSLIPCKCGVGIESECSCYILLATAATANSYWGCSWKNLTWKIGRVFSSETKSQSGRKKMQEFAPFVERRTTTIPILIWFVLAVNGNLIYIYVDWSCCKSTESIDTESCLFGWHWEES